LRLPDAVIGMVRFGAFVEHEAKKLLGMPVPGIAPHRFICMVHFQQTFDNSKAQRLLGYTSKVEIKRSVERIVSQWVAHTGARTGLRPFMTFVAATSLTSLCVVAGLLIAARRV